MVWLDSLSIWTGNSNQIDNECGSAAHDNQRNADGHFRPIVGGECIDDILPALAGDRQNGSEDWADNNGR